MAMAVAVALTGPGSATLAQEMTDSLPVTKVVLYTNGVAYFEHSGTVSGDQQFALPVESENMDDLLQSLVLLDHDGGTIRAVRYAAENPLSRTLASYSLDLSGNPSLADLLQQARGEQIELQASETVTGVIVSVERVSAPEEPDRHFLLLATDDGLKRILLDEVRSLEFENEQLREEMQAALTAVALHRDDAHKSVQLDFRGEGERFVQVGYVREMPVWKTSYRLVVGDDGNAELQGWAIFDNPTAMDLEDIAVTFVAGQPVSFITSLYEAVYVQRHRVGPPVATSAAPASFDAGFALAAPPSPVMAAPMAEMESSQLDFAARSSIMDAGVEAMASGTQSGVTFQYAVDEPVTVGRFESAMIPIVQQDIPAQSLSIFDPERRSDNPLRAVLLHNDTGLHLAAGTVTIFEDGSFTGTALMNDVLPEQDALLAYAADLAVTVSRSVRSQPERVLSMRIMDGVLLSEVHLRYTTRYEISGDVPASRLVAIEHLRNSGYELVSPADPAPLTTGRTYRFGVLLGADGEAGDLASAADSELPVQLECGEETCVLEVTEEQQTLRRVALSNMTLDSMLLLLENEQLDESGRQLLREFVEISRQIATVQRQIDELERQRTTIFQEQERIRANMAELDPSASLYQRYVTQLTTQEDELEEMRSSLTELEAEFGQLEEARADLLRSTGQ